VTKVKVSLRSIYSYKNWQNSTTLGILDHFRSLYTFLSYTIMRIDQNPLFRKVIVPWYDSEAACFIVIFFMLLVFLFGFAGISVARKNIEYHEHVWMPVLLVVMSGGVIISTTIRLIKRYTRRFSK